MPSTAYIDLTCSRPSAIRFQSCIRIATLLIVGLPILFRFPHIIVSRRASTGRPTRSALVLQRHPGVGRLSSLSADLNLSYLDDLTLGGP